MISKLFIGLLSILAVAAQSDEFNYDHRGADWEGTCRNGTHQSPINVQYDSKHTKNIYADESGYLNIDLYYEDDSLQGGFNSHTFMDPFNTSSTYDLGSISLKPYKGEETAYNAIQFHFHSPSEHTINGEHADLEMHIVHKTEDQSQITVIALFFMVYDESDQSNAFIESVISSETTPQNFDLQDLVNDEMQFNFYTYTGSLTTPPCTEGVTWILTSDVKNITANQLDFFTSKWEDNPAFANGNGNNRPTQSHNDRIVYYMKADDSDHDDDFGSWLGSV